MMLRNLKTFRVSRRMTQAEFADKLGYSRSEYCLIELGKHDPRAYFWQELSRVFRLDSEKIAKLMRKDV